MFTSKYTGEEIEERLDYIRPYKVYTAKLSQSGSSEPNAIVLENTLGGDILWTRNGVGQYTGILLGVFTEGKTVVNNRLIVSSISNVSSNIKIDWITVQVGNINTIQINKASFTTGQSNILIGDDFNEFLLEIRVYP